MDDLAPATATALGRLEQIVRMPDGPGRQAALEGAQIDTGELGRVTRRYLLTVAQIVEENS